ncbi:MAG: Branched-chain amino acid aminotransferase [uncultured Chloroflexi bacterium]|uniref:Branched-chain amino acid aminotransferase n=1 Tax=uncultured Chloroflexota bacterium TaxID=166587 RepID=A0A6J4HXF8_9CHLR|nr:MAG: Branched-chain amino acid aminotransferase [uncultured Chloroflexota bacterium]
MTITQSAETTASAATASGGANGAARAGGARTPRFLWMDGELVAWEQATFHASRLGWSTIGGVFEGIKAYWNPSAGSGQSPSAGSRHGQAAGELYGWQLAEHYARFESSMRLERMRPAFTPEQLVQASVELLRANECREDTYVRPLAWHADATWFGHMEDSRTGIVITTAPFKSVLGSGAAIRACVSSWTRVGDNQLSPRIKCFSNYQNSRMALLEATLDGYDQPILLNQQGKVTEGPASCLFIVRDGVVITPSLTSGILESITRMAVLRLCRDELGLPTQERDVDRTELYVADEVFFCGTGAEITAVGEVDHYRIGNGGVGPLTGRIERLFHDVVRGRHQGYAFWRLPVYETAVAKAGV